MIYIQPTGNLHTANGQRDFEISPVVKRKEALSNLSPISSLLLLIGKSIIKY